MTYYSRKQLLDDIGVNFKGLRIAVTGKSAKYNRREFADFISKNNGVFCPLVNDRIDILVVCDNKWNTSKANGARRRGKMLIEEYTFWQEVNSGTITLGRF
jgi:NAD-dependent DNA ligase